MPDSLLENPIFEEILRRYVLRAEQVISREVLAQGLVLSGEMKDSIRAAALEKGAGFIQGSVYYEALLRIKDLKTLHYTRMPPLTAMIRLAKMDFSQKYHCQGVDYLLAQVNVGVPVKEVAECLLVGGV